MGKGIESKLDSKEPIINCQNISKDYVLRRKSCEKSDWKRFFGLASFKQRFSRFAALKDVSLQVFPGECLAVLGENGSGKTTLLKLIAGITRPDQGTVGVRGRVGTLLEVGAGFHPEMTGRENILLSGAILGLTETEIEDRLQDIIEFSELEEFMDVPVKQYSSGMYVRLGFSVAIHALPEVLLLDEILAVGDEHFQKKCLGAILNFLQEGGTIVFVSHDLNAIRLLCTRAVFIDNGELTFDGDLPRQSSSITIVWRRNTFPGPENKLRESFATDSGPSRGQSPPSSFWTRSVSPSVVSVPGSP